MGHWLSDCRRIVAGREIPQMSRMSPVAENMLLKQALAKAEEGLRNAALQIFKLRQEVTGGLQIVWHLAHIQPEHKLTLNAQDLLTAMGGVRRTHNAEDDTYTFEALPPETDEERKARVEAKIAAAKEQQKLIVMDEVSEVQ